jgi:hypothetical protein
MKKLLVLMVILCFTGTAAAAWTEDFESYADGASIDTCDVPTWTISVQGAATLYDYYAIVFEDPEDEEEDQELQVGMSGIPRQGGSERVTATKDLTSQCVPDTDCVIVEYDYWTDAHNTSDGPYYRGFETYFNICMADGTSIVGLHTRDFNSGQNWLNGTGYTMNMVELQEYHFMYVLDTVADTVDLYIDGNPMVTDVALSVAIDPSDIAMLKFASGLYYQNSSTYHTTNWDNIVVPEPATIGLLLLGGLGLIRRR